MNEPSYDRRADSVASRVDTRGQHQNPDLIARILGALASINPSGFFRLAGFIGSIASGLRLYGPSVDDLHQLLGMESRGSLARSCRRISAQSVRIFVLLKIIGARGMGVAASLVDRSNVERFREACGDDGVVLAVWHLGVLHGLSMWLGIAGTDVVSLRMGPWTRIDTDPILTRGTEAGRVAGLRRVIKEIRNKRSAVVAVDGPDGSSPVNVEFLGRRVQFQRGAASLCRLTGAELLTLVSWWSEEDHSFKVDFARIEWRDIPHVDPEDFDKRLIQRLADWVSNRVRENPSLLAFQYGRYLACPRWEDQLEETIERNSS